MEWLLLALGLLLIAGTGFFVAVEFAFVATDQAAVQRAINDGDVKAETLMKGLKTLSTQLSSCQLGITLTTLLTGYVMEPSVGALLKQVALTQGLAEPAAQSLSLILAMVLATFLSMLLGELLPKNLSIAKAFQVGRVLAPFQLAFTAVFRPVIVLLNNFSNLFLHRFGLEVKEEISSARTPEELASLVRRSAMMGTLDAGTAEFVDRSLRFAERTAADVMTPRMRMETVAAEQSLTELIELTRSTGFSRFPVIGEDTDDIRGVTHVKKAAAVPIAKRDELVAATIMSEITRVPETMKLDALMNDLRVANLQMAVVVDEYGGTAGMVTLEDLVEEIVGDVADEHDHVQRGVLQDADGSWEFSALLRPDEISDQVAQLNLEDDPSYETVGGYLMYALGRIPVVGDKVELGTGTLQVLSMDGRRVDRVCFTPRPVSGTGMSPDGHDKSGEQR